MRYIVLALCVLLTGCANDNTKIEKKENIMCPQVYEPVCGEIAVECITAPCPKIQKTFSNACFLKLNPRATFLHKGVCVK